jgi:RNA polymerase sigma-70 factor (ECF subfamily)
MASVDLQDCTAFSAAEIGSCLPDLRAYARILAVERNQADRLVRKTVSHARRVSRRSSGGVSVRVELFSILHDLHYAPPHISVLPKQAASDGGFAPAFWELIDEQREVLLLRTAFDLSIEAIAEICDCSRSMIEMRMAKARGAMMWSYNAPTIADGPRLLVAFADPMHNVVSAVD